MSDIDGDSTMHSSPDFAPGDDDDEMFPDEAAGPSTPRNAATYALDPAIELSPPDSQGVPLMAREPLEQAPLAGATSATINANGKRVRSGVNPVLSEGAGTEPGQLQQDSETGYSWSKPEDQPGFAWKNQRAKDEALRALEQIVDKGSQIKLRYGDPLDPSIAPKKR